MKSQRSQFNTRLQRIDEAEETLSAIRKGTVDAFVVEEQEGHRVYALQHADLPYSALVERMQQGAAMLNSRGEIIYCNPSLLQLLGTTAEMAIGKGLHEFVIPEHGAFCQKLLRETQQGSSEGEMQLRQADGTLISANFSFKLLSGDGSTTGVLITDLTSQKQQEDLASRLQQSQDDERRRIARELHDSVGQLLAAISMNVSRVKTEAHKLSPPVAKLVDGNLSMIAEISDEIRTISHLLHPPLLDEVGLASALRWYVDGFSERSKIETTLEVPKNLNRLPPDMEIAIFRAVQECLTNVHRHSGSASCRVQVTQEGDQIRVEIKDSGRGISKAKISNLTSWGGVGFRGMRERLRKLGGSLQIESNEKGTTVRASLPRPKAGNDHVADNVLSGQG